MDYKEEIKEIIDKVYKKGYETGFEEGVKAKKEIEEITKKKFKVGDEVRDINNGRIGVIIRESQASVEVLENTGLTYWVGYKYLKRTGRRHQEIEEVLQKMRENNT